MSISAPRYAAGPVALVRRERRALAIYLRELRAQAGWGTWLVVAITYLAVVIIVVVNCEFASALGALKVATFASGVHNAVWEFVVLIVATAVASGSLAEDLASRSITLYLSRPIHLSDYLVAKIGAVATWIGVAAIGPGLVAVVLVATLGLSSFAVSVGALGAFLAIGALATVFFTGLGVALSALTARPIYAGVGIFGVTLSATISSEEIGTATGHASVLYASPVDDLLTATSAVFQTGESTPIDPWIASGLLLAVAAGLLALTWIRMRRVEVVGE